jgi:cobalt-zinc-cadmium efflux system protein
MLTDAAALGLSLVAVRLAARPARGHMTFGFKRSEILSAQFNGATLLVLGLFIVYGAIRRLVSPPAVSGLPVLVVALAGVVVNLAATLVLSSASRTSLNVRGAFQHIVTDLAAFILTAIAGAVILATGFSRADAVASLVIAGIMLTAAYRLLRDSGRIFLEASPLGLDPDRIGTAMAALPGVVEIHDLHVWEVTSGFPALSAHVLVGQADDCHVIGHRLKQLLHERFAIEHTTLQVEHASAELLSIEPSPGASSSVPDGRE